LHDLLEAEQLAITPAIKTALWQALNSLATIPQEQRTLTGLRALVQHEDIRQALTPYTLTGPFGFLLDGEHETLSDRHWQCFEMEALMNMTHVIAPMLRYLFHRLEAKFTGAPTLLILDEAWLFLDHPQFASQIRTWLKTLRKFNVAVVFATQSAEDALNTSIAPALLESCPSRILLPNDRIMESRIFNAYQKLGLNDRQCHILAQALPKRQYYFQSSLGNRLFDIECGPITLALCAAASPDSKRLIRSLLLEHGDNDFLQHYLNAVGLEWAWAMAKEHFK
jgi:type IV secretory pathway VirB4 component